MFLTQFKEYQLEQIINYNAKNGQETCSINNINIHSSYNPEKEAERFVDLIETTINPSIIFITEPGFSYCAKYLRQRFPNSKLICIRFCNSFSDYNSGWDFVINYEENINNLENILFMMRKLILKNTQKFHYQNYLF